MKSIHEMSNDELENDMRAREKKVIEILKADAIRVMHALGMGRATPILECDLGCLSAVVLCALELAQTEKGHLDLDAILRWQTIMKPIISQELAGLRQRRT